MNSGVTRQRNWVKLMTVVIPAAAIALVAPLSGCSKKKDPDVGMGELVGKDRPLYRPTRSGLSEDLAEIDRKTSENYRNTGSRAFAKEVMRRNKKGRRDSEVGMSRPGMSDEDRKAWEALGD